MSFFRKKFYWFTVLLCMFIAGSFTSLGPYLGRQAAGVVLRLIAGPPIIDTQEVLASPDSKQSLAILRVNSGGATVDFSYEIRVRTGTSEKIPSEEKLVWRSYGVRPSGVKWLNQNLIEVTIPAPTPGQLPLIERWPIEGILVIEHIS